MGEFSRYWLEGRSAYYEKFSAERIRRGREES